MAANPKKVAFFAVTTLLFLALQLSLMKAFPLTDEGQFLTMARMILSGKVPYRDFSDIHTPGLNYLAASALGLFGESYDVARGMMAVISLSTAFLVYLLGKRIFGEKPGMAAYLMFGIYAPVLQNFLMLPHPFLALLTAMAALLFLDYFETGKNVKLFLAGAVLGLAWLFRQNAVISMFGFFLALILFGHVGKRRTEPAVFVAGVALPIAAYTAYLFSVGALPGFVSDIFGLDYAHYARITLPSYPLFNLRVQLVSAFAYAFIFVLAARLIIAGKKPNPAHVLLVSWGVLSLLYLWPHFTYPFFITALVPGSVCAGWFFTEGKWRGPAVLFALLLLFISAYFYSHRSFRDEFSGNNEFDNYNFYEIPDYIRSHTRSGDTIYGFTGTVNYFLAGRNPASKHWVLRAFESDLERRQLEVIHDLRQNRPKYVAYVPNQFREEWVKDFAPLVNAYILQNYVVEKEFNDTPVGTVWLMVPAKT